MPRLPNDAFDQYVAMGPSATYVALAKKVGVSKRSIVRHASADNSWFCGPSLPRKAQQRLIQTSVWVAVAKKSDQSTAHLTTCKLFQKTVNRYGPTSKIFGTK